MNKKNDKWKELKSLQRQVEYDKTLGASDVVLAQQERRIGALKADIRREAYGQQDEVANTATKNRNALVGLVNQHGITIPAKAFATWRPTEPTAGTIDGLEHLGSLTIIATDGLQAYFLTQDGLPFYGHIQCFTGDVAPLFKTVNEKPIQTRRVKKPTLVQRALALLQEKLA